MGFADNLRAGNLFHLVNNSLSICSCSKLFSDHHSKPLPILLTCGQQWFVKGLLMVTSVACLSWGGGGSGKEGKAVFHYSYS